MKYNQLAIFERQTTLDDFGQSGGDWVELFQAYVNLEPVAVWAQRREFVESTQVVSQYTHRVNTHWQDGLKAQDRFKIARNEAVDILNPNADANFRIFNIESVINVREQNRELEMLVTERT